MTSPNEWWKEEPYCEIESHGTRDDEYFIEVYDIPAIIEEVKRREIGETTVILNDMGHYACASCKHWFHGTNQRLFNFCPHCGLKINWQ